MDADDCTQYSTHSIQTGALENIPGERSMGNIDQGHNTPFPVGDTLCSSIKCQFDWGGHSPQDVGNEELADWVAVNARITAEQAQWLKQFVAGIASGELYSEPVKVSKWRKEAGEQHKIHQAPH